MYTDGATEKNNPIDIADDERKFIWPKTAEHNRDIVLSIGAGQSTNYDQIPEYDQKLGTFLQGLQRFGFLRKLIVFKSVLQSAFSCQMMWNNFIDSLGEDDHLLHKCHRINIPYGAGQNLCNLDDWQRMNDAKDEALKVLSGQSTSVSNLVQDRLSDELDLIARQLVASLFYMSIQTLETNRHAKATTCSGRIRCRLGRSYQTQYHSLLNRNPAFRVIDNFGHTSHVAIDVRARDATFSFPAQFQVSIESAQVRVEVTLSKGRLWDTISGFPRHLHVFPS